MSDYIMPNNFTLQYDQQDNNNGIEYILMLYECHNLTNCASEQRIHDFFNQPSLVLLLQYTTKQFDPITRSIHTITQQQYINLEQQQTASLQINFRTTLLSVDENLLYNNPESQSYISDFSVGLQSNTLKYFQKNGLNIYLNCIMRLDKIQYRVYVQYAKLGNILAEVGSITSSLLMIGILFQKINGLKLEEILMDKIIQMYYPELKKIKLKRSLFGKLQDIQTQDQVFDKQQFIKYYKQLVKKARLKLSMTNQIYEISRMQFLLTRLRPNLERETINNYGDQLKVEWNQQPLNSNAKSDSKLQIYSEDRLDVFDLFQSK
ncbi:hypothetical protein pb186bvf_013467 [Paramecium bursaria]